MAAHKQDQRGAVVLVEQWEHEHGPSVWFPYSAGSTAQQRVLQGLRTLASVGHGSAPLKWVCVQERGQWVRA